MGYDIDDMWRVWSDLERKEDELKWGGRLSGVGPQFNSMGRPANASAHFNNGWASEQMGRVNRVRKALNDSGPMARSMIARTLSDIDLSTIWPILVSACQDIALCYGGSAAAGGLIGGVGGAFFGGVGAVPGAAAGAAAGGYVGGWVLAMLGLQSLVEGVAQAIPEALRCYEKGFLEAWGPTRHDHQDGFGMAARGDTSFAALQLANGHVIMISTVLTVLTTYVTRGKGDMLKDIRQSARLGPKVATWVEENKDKLGRHLALQSRGRGASPGAEPPPPKPRRDLTKEQERDAFRNSVRNSKIARDAKTDYGTNGSRPMQLEEIIAPNGKSIQTAVEGNAIVPLDKVTIYARGGVADVSEELSAWNQYKQGARKMFDANPENARRLEKLNDMNDNFRRSAEMGRHLDNIGLPNTEVNNRLVINHLLDAGQGINSTNRLWAPSVLEGPGGSLQVKSTWKILEDNRAYLSTLMLVPMK